MHCNLRHIPDNEHIKKAVLSRLLAWIAHSAMRHRAAIRALVPASWHHGAGRIARSLVRGMEASNPGLDRVEADPASIGFPPQILSRDSFEPRRILMVNDALSSGGAERQIVNLVTELAKLSAIRVDMLCWRLGETADLDHYLADLEQAGLSVRNVATGGWQADTETDLSPARRWLDVNAEFMPTDVRTRILDLVAELQHLRPAVLHGWQDETAIICAFAGMIAGVPRIVISTRSINPGGQSHYRPFIRAAYRVLARHPDIIFLNNSRAGAEDYAAWLDVAASRFKVVYNGIAAIQTDRDGTGSARERFGLPQDAPVIGSVFRLSEEKRPLLWLDTARALMERFDNIHFLIAGDGPMRPAIEAHAEKLGLTPRLRIPGAIRPVDDALAAMDLFLLTSRLEGLPNVTLEASLAGLPVVTTDAGGAAETIDEGRTGLVIRSEDGDDAELTRRLTDATEQLLSDRQLLEQIRVAGPEFVRERFGMDAMVTAMLEIYYSSPDRS